MEAIANTLASAADQVYLLPSSPLDLTGIASYEVFLRGALDKIGAFPDFVQIGPHKTAANQLTQRGFTDAHREMAESLNRDLYDQLVQGVAEGRKSVDQCALPMTGRFSPKPLTARASSTTWPTLTSSTIELLS